jgi:hypothetical protein
MFTTDRINRLLLKTGGVTIPAGSLFRYGTPAHDALDVIDKKVGIITRNRPRMGRAIYGGDLAQVGERLRRLERHILKEPAQPFFWLGAGAEAVS